MNYQSSNHLPDKITLGEYLLHRLKQLNVNTLFGLPGEFNMPLLDKISHIKDMKWVGNTNELNAAYAADGYSRLKRMACLMTTFGVGELSVLGGIAGSFAEHVGLIHVVGMPPTSVRTKQLLVHHTLGNRDYNVFYRMANDISCYSTLIEDKEFCYRDVDKCIEMAYLNQRPTYLGVPVNFVNILVDSAKLNKPLKLKNSKRNMTLEDEISNSILKKLYATENPVIIVDGCIIRHGLTEETEKFIKLTNFPTYVTPMGKGAVDETLPNFNGVFIGSLSSPSVREVVDFADFVIVFGCLSSNFSTSSFHLNYKAKNKVLIFDNYVKIKNAIFPDIYMEYIITRLNTTIDVTKVKYNQKNLQDTINLPKYDVDKDKLLKQEWVWNELSHWFKPGDIIITEIGTSSFGINRTKFPKHTQSISQSLWGASGYSIGSCLGVCKAMNELKVQNPELPHNRVILFVGDGSFQIAMQEISTIIRLNLTPYIFLLNNQGFSVDRFLHHRSNASYYDIQSWHYLNIFSVFGAVEYETRKVVTFGDLKEMVNDEAFAVGDKIRMMEIMLPTREVPKALLEKWIREKQQDDKISESPFSILTNDSEYNNWTDDGPTPKRIKTNSVTSV